MTVNPIHLDNNILIIDKPALLSVLPEGWDQAASYLVNILEQEYGKIFVVHRLDKLTSGVMVLARTPAAHRCLSLQFERGLVSKIYHCLSVGVPAWEERIAAHPLVANVGHKHRTVVDPVNGKPSRTMFKVIRKFKRNALLEAAPLSGRTHQVRVHAYALGLPLLGDPLYGSSNSDLINRPALHALSISLQLPITNDWSEDLENSPAWSPVTFTSPYPQDFEAALVAVAKV